VGAKVDLYDLGQKIDPSTDWFYGFLECECGEECLVISQNQLVVKECDECQIPVEGWIENLLEPGMFFDYTEECAEGKP